MTEIKPVAWAYEVHDYGVVWSRHVILNRPDGGANPPTKHYGSEIRNVRPLYGPEAMAEIKRLKADASTSWEQAGEYASEIARLQKVVNQCRLAFAGSVSVQSAIDMIDAG